MIRLELYLPNSRTALEEIREPLEKFYAFHKLTEEITYALDLALDEVINNIITYANLEEESDSIYLQLEKKDSIVQLTIEDKGIPFNPLQAPSPNVNSPLEERKVGGLGLFLTNQFMDEIHYQRIHQKNKLKLIKNI